MLGQSSQQDQDSQGILEEISCWRKGFNNLQNLSEQLESPKVLSILCILNNASSAVAKSINKIKTQAKERIEQFREILQFIPVLEQPCLEIAELASSQIPKFHTKFFFGIRMLFEKCAYFGTDERVANLFRKVSNEIIKRCCSTISLSDLANGQTGQTMVELDNAKSCCQQWRETYTNCLKHMKNKKVWSFDTDSIFAQIEAFIERCNNLKEICDSQIQFSLIEREKPFFSGNRSNEIK